MSDDAPLVTVGVPTYNSAALIGRSLGSILSQTYRNLDVLVVDDGSVDDTEDRVRALDDPRLRYVRNPKNIGGYRTMNRAVELARGTFVAIYHADDLYDETIVEKEVDRLVGDPEIGAVFALDHYMDTDGRVFGGTDLPKALVGRRRISHEDLVRHLVRRKNTIIRSPTFMARRDVLDAVGLIDADRWDEAGDLDWWLRLTQHAPIAILDERLVRYRVSPEQWSTSYNRLRTVHEQFFDVLDHHLAEGGWWPRLSAAEKADYRFLRRDDETFRAVNNVILGDPAAARRLLEARFPWRCLLRPSRRKLRVVLQRAMLHTGLRIGGTPVLRRLLIRMEYGGSV